MRLAVSSCSALALGAAGCGDPSADEASTTTETETGAETETEADGGSETGPDLHAVRVNLVDLKGEGLRLTLGEEVLEVTSPNDPSFETRLAPGDAYEVGLLAQPRWPSQTCEALDSAGVIADADVTITVECTNDSAPGLDLDYGDEGLTILNDFSGFENSGDVPFDLSLAPDGGLVIAGQALSTNEFDGVLWRLDPTGQPDLEFGLDGLVLHDEMMFETFVAAVVAGDSSVYAIGRRFIPMSGSDLMIVHVLADGSLDLDFGGTGSVIYDNLLGGCPDQFVIDSAFDLALTADGLLVAGTTTEPDCDDTEAFVARFDPLTGALDPAYGAGGVFGFGGGLGEDTPNDVGNALAVRADGSVWVSGVNSAPQGTEQESALLWLVGASGGLEQLFGDAGVVALSDDGSSHAWAVAITGDGSALVIGEEHGDQTTMVAWRVLADGALDPGFASAGALRVDNNERYVAARRVAIDSADRIVILGTRNNLANDGDLAVWRFDQTGVLDESFADDGLFVWDGLGRDVGWGLAIDSNDRVLVSASRVVNDEDVEMAVLRIADF